MRHSVHAILSDVGVRDDRIPEALVAELEVEPDLGAMHERGEAFASQALIELEAAIEDLAGELTPAQKDKVERAINLRRAAPDAGPTDNAFAEIILAGAT